MTLLTIEGFEARSPRMGWVHSNMSTPGRFGGICAHTGSEVTFALPYPAVEVVTGFAMKVQTGGNYDILRMYQKGSANGRESLNLRIRADRSLAIHLYNPSNSTYDSPVVIGASPIGENLQWVYVEIRARIASVGGYMDIRVNGAPYLSYAGNTLPAAHNGTVTDFSILQWLNPGTLNYDDVYICDRLGSELNDFIGEIQVEGLFPNGNGASSQLVGSDGNSVDNYLLVDEAPAVETDLVQSDVVGAKDTYQFTNLAVAQGQILAVQPTIYLSKTNAGPAAAKVVERLANGTERKSAAFLASNLMPFGPLPMTRDPEGAVWTQASVNAAEFGVEVA